MVRHHIYYASRLNSVARVMYGDDRGKAVMVRSVNYESGMAVVAVVPDSKEMMLPIGCLEEIGPDEDAPIEIMRNRS